ncbi:hypothetical protein [Pseudoduganella albidiflava]|nr:hypothetical protein [Pseudoduganella albidiflava]QBI03110.1 hypothetical protein EYF70_21440 [Pseudoduganella albidiflava]
MKNILSIAGILLCLVACSSSGPVQTGADTYMITKQSAGGLAVPGARVKAEIIGEANQFCAKSGKRIELLSATSQNAIPFARMSSAEINFKCV